jgi:uncharacterized protein (DUF302 family)
MKEQLIIRSESARSVDDVVAGLEKEATVHQFRVLHVHDVQATLAEKGFHREPLKIVEICSAAFAHQALNADVDVSIFMPCRYTVYSDSGRTRINLARPTVISQMLPESGLDELATSVEEALLEILKKSV